MHNCELFTSTFSLESYLSEYKVDHVIGFVPTMGALHHGHLSLVKRSLEECDITVVSIFVNPTQFNNSSDLENYPRTLENDLKLLRETGEVVVFAPQVHDIYPDDYVPTELDLGTLATVMEGKFRDGHFDGVVNVVKRLFDIVQPTNAYFGRKDFQQVAVLRFMVEAFNLPIHLIACDIIREESGLASSSRNVRLSEKEKQDAIILYDTLKEMQGLTTQMSPNQVKEIGEKRIQESTLELEYLEIVDPKTLLSIDEWVEGANACVAAYCGEVRLIDNMQLIEQIEK